MRMAAALVLVLAPFVGGKGFVVECILVMARVLPPMLVVDVECIVHHFAALVSGWVEVLVLVVRIRTASALSRQWMCQPFECLGCPFS